LSIPDCRGCAVAVVGVLILEPVVLLVKADDILQQNWVSFGVGPTTIEIFNVAQTIAAKG
jgi:hypothetical protein